MTSGVIAGEFCEKKIIFCTDFDPCANGATCVNLDTDYRLDSVHVHVCVYVCSIITTACRCN